MKYELKKKYNKQGWNLKRYVFAVLTVLFIVFLMFFDNFLNYERSEPSELQIEELPMPEKKQGEPEITKLNADQNIKDGW